MRKPSWKNQGKKVFLSIRILIPLRNVRILCGPNTKKMKPMKHTTRDAFVFQAREASRCAYEKGWEMTLVSQRNRMKTSKRNPNEFQISGVPRDWMAEELVDFLKQQGWTQMTIHNRRRVNKKIFWNACGMPPVAYPYDQGLWVYEGATVFTIIVNDSVHKPAAPNSTTAVRGPRKTWDEIKDQPPQTANTRGRPAKRQAKEPGERHRSRSAAEKPEKGDENKDPMEVKKPQLDSQTSR